MMALLRNRFVNEKAGILFDLTLATGGWQLAFGLNSQLIFSCLGQLSTFMVNVTQPVARCQQPAA